MLAKKFYEKNCEPSVRSWGGFVGFSAKLFSFSPSFFSFLLSFFPFPSSLLILFAIFVPERARIE